MESSEECNSDQFYNMQNEDAKLSSSPLMESLMELSHQNINKYFRTNFKDPQIFDCQTKRNYKEVVNENKNEQFEEGSEEKKTKRAKKFSLIETKLE